jgi:hypothetical protein
MESRPVEQAFITINAKEQREIVLQMRDPQPARLNTSKYNQSSVLVCGRLKEIGLWPAGFIFCGNVVWSLLVL